MEVKKTDVAIIGMGFRLPGSPETPDEFYYNLLNKKDCISKCPNDRFNNDYFKSINESPMGGYIDANDLKSIDQSFFGLCLDDCVTLEPQGKILLKCAFECFENANMNISDIRGSNISVFVGSHFLEYRFMNSNGPYFISYAPFIANTISYGFDLRGESVYVNTACSSSFTALNLAYESIVNGKSVMALAGGANSMLSVEFLSNLSIVSDMGNPSVVSKSGRSKTFEKDADGYCRGEGGVVILLKSLTKAIEDNDKIYGIIKTVHSNNDGFQEKNGKLNPSANGQCDNIKRALESISMDPSEIYYVEPHGTGTATGDPIEIKGIGMAFGGTHNDEPLYIGSTKPSIGHLESASGLVSLMKACLMLKHRKFVPMYSFKNPNPLINFDQYNLKVLTEPMPFPDKKVNIGINNFGICGTNYFAIISEYNDKLNSNETKDQLNENEYLIKLSANSYKSLMDYQNKLISSIDTIKQHVSFQDFIKSISLKSNFYNRCVIKARDWDDLKNHNIITSNESNIMSTSSFKIENPIVFVLCGQGAQYCGMLTQLYNSNLIFKNAVIHCDSIFKNYYGYSIYDKFEQISQSNKKDAIYEPIIAQPSTFLVQYGLIELYKFWGVKPSAVVGHSFGDIVMAYVSGMVTLEGICKIIYYRSIAQNKSVGFGKMLSVSISKNQFIERFSHLSFYNEIEIGCYNSLNSIVLVSTFEILDQVKSNLQKDGIFAVFLSNPSPFHSNRLSFLKDEILAIPMESNKPSIPCYSTVTGRQWDDSIDKFDSIYSYDNMVKPVLFHDAINNILENEQLIPNKQVIFVEISPHPVLSYYLKALNDQGNINISVVNSINRSDDHLKLFKESIAKIYCNGGCVDFTSQLPESTLKSNSHKWVSHYLPRYQWDEKPFFYEDESHFNQRTFGPPTTSLGLKESSSASIVYQTIIELTRDHFKYISDHKVFNTSIYYPGCAYVEAILKYYKDNFRLNNIKISNLQFINPFILNTKSKYYLQVVITKISKYEDYIQFFKKELIVGLSNNNYDSWLEVCNGKVSTLPQRSNERKLSIDEIKSKCILSSIKKEELYSSIKEYLGISYGPSFQLIEKAYYGDNITFSVGSIKNKLSYFDKDFFNTTILDASSHALLLINLDKRNNNLVLGSFEDIKFYINSIPHSRDGISNIYYYSRLTKITEKSKYFYTSIILEDGTIIADYNVVATFIKPIKDKISIKNPNGIVYSNVWQCKDSPLKDPSSITMNKVSSQFIQGYSNPKQINNYIAYKYIKSFEKRGIPLTVQIIKSSSIEELVEKYLQDKKSIICQRLFTKAINIIKNNDEWLVESLLNDQQFNPIKLLEEHYCNIQQFFSILSVDGVDLQVAQLFKPTLQEEIEEAKIEKFKLVTNSDIPDYLYKKSISNLHDEFCNRLLKMLEPLLYQRYTFKICEMGGGTCGMAFFVLKSIHQLLNNHPDHLLQVHYNFSDISPSFIPEAMKLLNQFTSVIISYNAYDLDKSLVKQGLNPSSYDLVLMQFVLHAVKDVNFSVKEIFNILNPSGHLMFYEPSKYDSLCDMFFSNFEQWVHYSDNIRTDHCCLNVDEWMDLLIKNGFKCNIACSKDSNDYTPSSFIIDSQKPSLSELVNSNNNNSNKNNSNNNNSNNNNSTSGDIQLYNQSFIYISENQHNNNNKDKIVKYYSNISNKVNIINNINQINSNNNNSNNSGSNIIVYAKGLENIDQDSIETSCMELTSVLQYIMKHNLQSSFRILLLTLDAQLDSTNYLNNSLIGVIKYFFVHQDVKCYSVDLDQQSLKSPTIYNQIQYLIGDGTFIERYFAIRNNMVLIEKVHIENNRTIKTSSFEQDNLMVKINSKLNYDLVCKPTLLKENQIEVQVCAVGINAKDSLIMNSSNKINEYLGSEFSGIITRVGKLSKGNQLKVGDHVYGFGKDCLSSHVVLDQDNVAIKPLHLSFEQAASIPISYSLSYYSLFNIGKVKDANSILIHSATSDLGLATLNLLEWINFSGIIMATVGNDAEKEFLIGQFDSSFINGGIYSNQDNQFVYDIKQYLKDNSKEQYPTDGIDIIINTLPHYFMVDNISLLSDGGSLVDYFESDTNCNEFVDFKTFSGNFKYTKINSISPTQINLVFKEIDKLFNDSKQRLLPNRQYSITQITTAFQDIKDNSILGKATISLDDECGTELFNNKIKENQFKFNIPKDDYSIKDEQLGSTVLITGQRGVGLTLLKWISKFSKNVKDIIILSRSSIHWELEYTINYFKSVCKNSIRYHYKCIDIGNKNELKDSINEIYSNVPSIKPVESIFHFAFELSDASTSMVSLDNFIKANHAKSHGAIHLHNLSIELNWNLKSFLLNSSFACITGSESQIAYISSNSVVEGLARYRRSKQLNALVIKWGALQSSYVTRNVIVNFKDIKTISTSKIIGALDLSLQSQDSLTELIFTNSLQSNSNNLYLNHFDHTITNEISNYNKPKNENLSIKDQFINKISNLLQIDANKINLNMKLKDFGSDSLLMVQFKNWVDKFTPLSLEKLQNSTIHCIIDIVQNSLAL